MTGVRMAIWAVDRSGLAVKLIEQHLEQEG